MKTNEVKLSTPDCFNVGTPINGVPKSNVKLSVATLEEKAKHANDQSGFMMVNQNVYSTNVCKQEEVGAIIICVLILFVGLCITLYCNKKKIKFYEID